MYKYVHEVLNYEIDVICSAHSIGKSSHVLGGSEPGTGSLALQHAVY